MIAPSLDRASQTWAAVEAWADKEIEAERTGLENGVGEVENHRGALRKLRELLALGQPGREPAKVGVGYDAQ